MRKNKSRKSKAGTACDNIYEHFTQTAKTMVIKSENILNRTTRIHTSQMT